MNSVKNPPPHKSLVVYHTDITKIPLSNLLATCSTINCGDFENFSLTKMAGPVAGQATGRALRWWTRVRDMPEVTVLGGLVGGVVLLASYTIKKTLLNNESGSYPSIVMRGDPWKQVETGRVGLEDASTGKHSWLWKVAQYKVDKDGANIGILFDNRVRPQQYSKPGAGIGGGIQTLSTL